jgi:hypothetical protein
MDFSSAPPESGAGSSFAHAPPSVVAALGATPVDLTPKEAARYFDYVKNGTCRTLILLGDVVSQRMHFVMKLNYKVQCTSKLGECPLCKVAGSGDDNVSKSHLEHYAPSAVLQKDRKYHQRVVILTDDMYQGREGRDRIEGLHELLTDGPARGHAFELRRDSKHHFRWTRATRSPRAMAHALPPSFDVLPWNRARFGNPQDPARPLTLFAPFALHDLGAQPSPKPRELDIAPSDVRSAEEWENTRAKLREAKERATAAGAGAPPAPGEPAEPKPTEATPPAAPPAKPAPGWRLTTPTKEVTFTVADRPDRPAADVVVTAPAAAGDAVDAVLTRARRAASRNGHHAASGNGGAK